MFPALTYHWIASSDKSLTFLELKCLQVILPSPLLLEKELEAIKTKTDLKHKTLSLHYKSGKVGALAEALKQLCKDAEEAVKDGNVLLILSDRAEELDPEMPPVPTLLAVGSVHHHLIK